LRGRDGRRVAALAALGTLLAGTGLVRPALAQTGALPPGDPYTVRAYSIAEGLPVSDIQFLEQAADGHILLAVAQEGLFRFDGYAFRPIRLTGFDSRSLNWLQRDPSGRVWTSNAVGDLGFLDVGGRFHPLPGPPAKLYGITETRDGEIWMGTAAGLVHLRLEEPDPYETVGPDSGLPADTIQGLVELPSGERLVVSKDGLYREQSDRDGRRYFPLGPRVRVRRVALRDLVRVDPSGLWLGAWDGLLHYDGHAVSVSGVDEGEFAPPSLPDSWTWPARPLTLDDLEWARGAVVPVHVALRVQPPDTAAAASLGVLREILDASDGSRILREYPTDDDPTSLARELGGRVEPLSLSQHLPFRDVGDMLEDHEGSIWIATDRGLVQLAPRRVYALDRGVSLPERFTTAICQTRDGTVWVGTWGGGLHAFRDGRETRRFTADDGLFSNEVRALHEDDAGTLWVGTSEGVQAIRGRPVGGWRGRYASAFAETVIPGGRRVLAVASHDGLQFLPLDELPRDSVPSYEPFPGVEWGWLWALHADSEAGLWVGGTGGLFHVDGDSVRRYGPEHGLATDEVSAIHSLSDGSLWVSTYGSGLYRVEDETFTRLTVSNGLPADGIWAMVEDGRGGVWMSSDFGIARVGLERLHAVADSIAVGLEGAHDLEPMRFTEAEGMPIRENNRASPAGWRLTDGTIVFNSMDGPVVIDPEVATRPLPTPKTAIEDVLADGVSAGLAPEGPLELALGTRYVTFEFAALSFAAPSQRRYRYRLDGYDDEWIDGGGTPRTTYTGLTPGRYTFRVQGASGGTGWGEETRYAIVLPGYFWQSAWFRVAGVLAVLGILVLVYRARVAHLLEMEHFRLRIASDLHDDIGSNLSSISLLTEMLQGQAAAGGLERRQLERIRAAASDTIDSLREIIWLVDPTHERLPDLVCRLQSLADQLLDAVPHTFTVHDAMPDLPLDMSWMRNVLFAFKESLSNAARHASPTRVDVDVRFEGGWLSVEVLDDGVGFDSVEVRRGHGRTNMRRRMEAVSGELEIVSAVGDGTAVRLSAPVG